MRRNALCALGCLTVVAALALAIGGCRSRAYVRAQTIQTAPPPASGGVTIYEGGGGYEGGGSSDVVVAQPAVQAQGSFELLYLPVDASMVPLHLVQAVVVQTDDGRSFQLTPADLMQGMGGRVAVRVPAGVTTGTATVYLTSGQVWSTTFHIAASSSGLSVGVGGGAVGGGAVVGGPASDPRCGWPSGTWQGSITRDPNRATVWLEVLGDCRTVRGYVHLDSSGGSVDSTIEGTWDVGSMTITARDTQLFNVRPMPGGGFCATDQYRLQLAPDGSTMQGSNDTWSSSQCRGSSPVWLARAR